MYTAGVWPSGLVSYHHGSVTNVKLKNVALVNMVWEAIEVYTSIIILATTVAPAFI